MGQPPHFGRTGSQRVWPKLTKWLFHVFQYLIGKSSTSIGANYHEANRAESVTDFIHKIGIALKEAEETVFWLRYLIGVLPDLVEIKRGNGIVRDGF